MPARLQGLHNFQFMLWRDARIDRHFVNHGFQFRQRHGFDFLTSEHAAIVGNRQFTGNGLSRERVVAGDHHWADARALAGGDGFAHFGAGRVDHAC